MSVERLRYLCTKPPNERRNIDVEIAVSWLRSHSEAFREIDREVWREIVKNCGYHHAVPDEVILKQGELGTCMYIMLTGRASVYIENFSPDEHLMLPGTQDIASPSSNEHGRALDRSLFGKLIIHFEKGRRFGEMALMKEEGGTRNASIICDQSSDLLVIDKQLFLSHLKGLESREYQRRIDFINQSPLFGKFPPHIKRLLEMSLRKESYSFNNVIRKQGDRATDVFFIISKKSISPLLPELDFKLAEGKVKVGLSEIATLVLGHIYTSKTGFIFVEARLDWKLTQLLTSAIIQTSTTITPVSKDGLSLGYLQEHVRLRRLEGYSAAEQRNIQKTARVCSLQENAIFGDIEVLLGLDTFLHTAVSETYTELYVVDSKHFERLIYRKSLKGSEKLKMMAWSKLLLRLETTNLPIMQHLLDKLKTVIPRKYLTQPNLFLKETAIPTYTSSNTIKVNKNIRRAKSANASFLVTQQSKIEKPKAIIRRKTALSIQKLSRFNLRTYDQMKRLQRSFSFPEFGRQGSITLDQIRPQTSFHVDKHVLPEKTGNTSSSQHFNQTKDKRPRTSPSVDTRNRQKVDPNVFSQMELKRPNNRPCLNDGLSSDGRETRTILTESYTRELDGMFNVDFDFNQTGRKSASHCKKTPLSITPNENSNSIGSDSLESLIEKFRIKLEEFESQKSPGRHSPTDIDFKRKTRWPTSQLTDGDTDSMDLNTSSAKIDRLENRVKSFCHRHGESKRSVCSNQAFQLRSIDLQELPRKPLLGGRVLVTSKVCSEPSALDSSQHKHIRRFLMSKSPGVFDMQHI